MLRFVVGYVVPDVSNDLKRVVATLLGLLDLLTKALRSIQIHRKLITQ